MPKLLVFLALGVPTLLAACGGGDVVEGVVAHKAITGVKGDSSFTILTNRPRNGGSSIAFSDKDYEVFFSEEDQDATVGESLENEMKQEYSEINYLVNMRVPFLENATQPYRVSREAFNKMKVGSAVKFKSSGLNGIPQINKVLEYSD